MKPDSIRKFDWLYLGSIAVGLIGIVFGYRAMSAQVEAQMAAQGAEGLGVGVVIAGIVIGIAINLALWAAISIWRIGLLKWILIALIAWSIYTTFGALAADFNIAMVCGFVSTLMSIVAVSYLFRPDAEAWFAEREAGEGDDDWDGLDGGDRT